MQHYDIVFIGQFGTGAIVPFKGSPFVEQGSPILFAPIAASCPGRKIAAVTGISENEERLTVSPRKAKAVGVSGFLMKPMETKVLAGTVRRVLDARDRN